MSEQHPTPVTYAVITKNRPRALQRFLRSLAGATEGTATRVVICDQSSRSVAHDNQIRVHVVAANAPHLQLEHLHEQATADFIRYASEVVPPDVARFAFAAGGGRLVGTGANRNLALAATGTGILVCADDDTTFRSQAAPLRGLPPRVTAKHPLRADFFPSVDDCLDAAETSTFDFSCEHRFLLTRAPQATPCLVSMAGFFGDIGSLGATGFLRSPPPSLRAHYTAAVASRAARRVAPAACWSRSRFLMTPNFALFPGATATPFLPMGRNQDRVFVEALFAAEPSGVVGHLGRAVEHLPDEQRDGRVMHPFLPSTAQPGYATCMTLLSMGHMGSGSTRAERRDAYADTLQGIAEDPQHLAQTCRERCRALRARMATEFREVLKQEGPQAWKQDIRTFIGRVAAWEGAGAPVHPWQLDDDPQQAFAQMRTHVLHYAALLRSWRSILEAVESQYDRTALVPRAA